jgi:DNA-binding MarR family transcriptional regulator
MANPEPHPSSYLAIRESYARELGKQGGNPDVFRAYAELILAAQGGLAYIEERVLRPEGLSPTGWRLLISIAVGGPTEPHSLSNLLFISRATIVTVVNTLEAAGWVQRHPHPTDGRRVIVDLTASGRELVARVQGPYIQAQGDLFGGFTPRQLVSLATMCQQFTGRARALSQGLPNRRRAAGGRSKRARPE